MEPRRGLRIGWTILVVSVLYVGAVAVWIASGDRSVITIMELLTIWAAIVLVQFMVEVHLGARDRDKSRSLVALVLTAAMAVVTITNHFMYLTVLPRLFPGADLPEWLLLDGWPSITKGLECVAWALFLGLAMIYASGVPSSLGTGKIAWTLRISGVVTLAGLAGPVSGNMSLYMLSTVGYSVGLLVVSIELISAFRGAGRPAVP
jgi:hypothetical protein